MLIIDRIEGEMAVIEYQGRTFTLPCDLLPPEAREGQALRLNITIDHKKTKKRRANIKQMMDELFED